MKIAILSTGKLPRFLGADHPDEASLFAEDDRLIAALAERGVAAERLAWRQTAVDWAAFDLVAIRSTWDYIDDLPGFLEVLACIEAAGCRLVNPLHSVRWNCSKRYLKALSDAGLPVVPSRFLAAAEDPADHLDFLIQAGPNGVVRKPAIGVGGYGVERLADAAALREAGPRDDESLLQPFVEAVTREGEWSFVFGAGRFLYAAQKRPASGDFRVQVMYGAETRAATPEAHDLASAEACYRGLPVPAGLARIDMTRGGDGRLMLMEAELIEPQLYLFDVAEAADLLAEAILELAGRVP